MKNILVTGGNGYIGSRLCLYLADLGHVVTSVCYPDIPADKEWVEKMKKVIVGDVRDSVFLSELANDPYDVLIHLVSLDHRDSEGDPLFVSSVNITPVWRLLDLFSKRGLKKFVYFSTIHVYGKLPNEVITEQRDRQVINAYGLTHSIGEEICDFYNRISPVDCRVVRLSNSYGTPIFADSNCWWLVVNDLCKQAYCNRKMILQSDGTPQRDFIHGWDVCKAVRYIMDTEKSGSIFQISSGRSLTIWEIACLIQRIYKKRYGREICIYRQGDTPTEVKKRFFIDNSLLLSTGFEPDWSLERGIDDLFTFLEENVKK